MSSLKFAIEDFPQFIIQMFFLLSTDCGENSANIIVYLSILTAVLSSYCGFLFRLTIYLYNSKRLYAYQKKVEVQVNTSAIEKYGFNHIKKMMKLSNDCQFVKLNGTNNEYFQCNEKRLKKIQNVIIKIHLKDQIEFFEINRCTFDKAEEV